MMKSGKQKRLEIKEKRRKKTQKNVEIDIYSATSGMPSHAIRANHDELAHNNTYGLLPLFYVDKEYQCRDCGSYEVWTAKQQKWWYEIAKRHIDSTAVRCRRCRNAIKDQKIKQKAHMEAMAQRIPHPNEAFFKKKIYR